MSIRRISLILRLFLALVVLAGVASGARAQDTDTGVAPPDAPDCTMEETAQVDIVFSGLEGDIRQIKQKVDGRISEARKIAYQLKINQIDVQNQNFSISRLNAEGCTEGSCRQYQYNGGVSFVVSPTSAATEYMALLIDNGFNANLNVSSYRQCP